MTPDTPIEDIKHFTTTSIADGTTVEFEWTPSEDYVIEKIVPSEESGTDLNHTDATVRIGNEPKTLDEANIQLWQTWYSQAPYLGWELPADTKLYISMTNHEGASNTYNLDVYLSKP